MYLSIYNGDGLSIYIELYVSITGIGELLAFQESERRMETR